jgi:hypothetical protein
MTYGEPNRGASHGMTAHFCRNFLSKLESFRERSRDGVLVAVVFLLAFGAVGWMAASMGIADGESRALEAGTAYGRLWEMGAVRSLGGVTRDDLRHELGGLGVAPFFPFGWSGYLWLALARRADGGWCDELWALRVPAVFAAALVPTLVFWLGRRSLGRPFALLAAFFCLAGPRLLVGGASLAGGAPLTASMLLWFVGWEAAERARERGAAGWMVLLSLGAGAAWGQALALSWFAWVFAVPAVWSAFHQAPPAAFEPDEAPTGLLILSPALGLASLAAALVALASTPTLWPPDAPSLLAVFQRALEPAFTSNRAIGLLPAALQPPRWHGVSALLVALPSTTLALALVGLVVALAVRPGSPERSTRAATRWGTAPRGWVGLSALLLAVPLFSPRALSSYPSPYSVVIPWLALLAAHGARFVFRAILVRTRAAAPERGRLGALGLFLVLVVAEPLSSSLGFGAFATAPAAFPSLIAAPASDEARGRVAAFDSALVGHRAMAAALAPLCRPPVVPAPAVGQHRVVRVFAPSISPSVWEPLRRFHRLPCAFLPVRLAEQADLLVFAEGDAARVPPPRNAEILGVPGTVRGSRTLLRFWVRTK